MFQMFHFFLEKREIKEMKRKGAATKKTAHCEKYLQRTGNLHDEFNETIRTENRHRTATPFQLGRPEVSPPPRGLRRECVVSHRD